MTSVLLLLLLLPTTSLSSSSHSPSTSAARRFSKIYAFGDSYTDTGNTHSADGPYSFGYVSSPPYGTTFFHRSTNRYSDGRLVVDFLTTALSLPFLPPYLAVARNPSGALHGVNFAVAGSTAIEHEFYVQNNITIDVTPQSLMTQLGWFQKHVEAAGTAAGMDEALFWVGEIGANDYAYSSLSSVSPSIVQDLAVRNVFSFLEALLNKGAKYIVVQGLPLTGCLPLSMTVAPQDDRDDIGCVASVNKQSSTHNTLLLNKLNELRRRYPKAVISYADYHGAHHAIMKNPAAHGFTETFKTCCGSGGGAYNFDLFATCGSPGVNKACSDPAKFVNWDGVHLTEAMYKAVANMFFNRGYCRPGFDVLLSSKGDAAK
ncbi:GDSL esterase/lipase [Ananas comosus]|uniref:GDSL esterase/lipase n=1 Tax=Ananas comosus TaxID=4615 RepID=A0A199VTS3_ANACO|nr:GDSL esterase/lipase [Ananas comosus]